MRAVNLLPAPRRKSYADVRLPLPGFLSEPAKAVAILGGLLVFLALGIGYVTQNGAVNDRRQTLELLQAEAAARAQAAAPATEDAGGPRLAAVKAEIDARVEWDEVLQQFALVVPNDVTVTGLRAAAPGAAADPAAAATIGQGMFTLEGYTASQPAVARLLTRVSQVPALENVQLLSTTRVEIEGRPVIQFMIVAGVRPGGGN